MTAIRLFVAAAFAASLMFSHVTLAADATKGNTAYVKHGCWQCHGFVGQGSIAGPKLAPDPKPFEVLSAFTRHSTGPMPPYTATILPDADLADIYAYLKSIPKTADYKSIPLLNN